MKIACSRGWTCLVSASATAADPYLESTVPRDGTTQAVSGLGDAVRWNHAKRLFEVDLPAGLRLYTHGGDPGQDDPGQAGAGTASSNSGSGGSAPLPGAGRALPCRTSDSWSYVYVYPTGSPDRFAAVRSSLQDYMERANAKFDSQAYDSSVNEGEPRRHADLWSACSGPQHDANACPASDFGSAAYCAYANGFNDPSRKYLVFFDGSNPSGYSGYSSVVGDARRGALNCNNNYYSPPNSMASCLTSQRESRYSVVYAGARTRLTLVHEMSHSMGGVQQTGSGNSNGGPPHPTDGWHCWDGYDIMCYNDGGPFANGCNTPTDPKGLSCAPLSPISETPFLDRAHDDFFDTYTEVGEWLASHHDVGQACNGFMRFTDAAGAVLPCSTY
ncbi:MAG: hypothetical protein U0T02_07920 [Solirubrobacteraceae bacterium]